jgi:hypothetical protein
MATRPIWKHPDDRLFRTLSFDLVLPGGVNLQSSPLPTIAVAPAGALTGAVLSVAGQAATFRLDESPNGGADGSDYLVTVAAVADNGEIYNRAVTVKVRTGI